MILIVALFGLVCVIALAFQFSVLVGLIVTLPAIVVWFVVGFLLLDNRDK